MDQASKTSTLAKRLLQPNLAKKLLLLTIVITVVLSLFLPRLRFQFELETLFAQSEDFEFYKQHVAEFGFDNDFLTVIVLPEDGSIYDWAFIEDMKSLTTQFETLADVAFVASPLNLRKLIRGATGVQTYPLFSSASQLQNDSLFIAQNPYLSQAISPDDVFVLSIKHRHFLDTRASDAFMAEIQPYLEQIPYEKHVIGRLPAEKEFLGFIKTDFAVFLALSLLICALVLWWICKSWKLVLYPFVISVLTLIWTFGCMALFGVPITIMTSLLPPIVLFVACSDTIHLISAYRSSQDAAKAIQKVLAPTFLTSVTTAIGFLSLLLVPVELIRAMGWVAATSVIFAFFTTYALAPLFLKGETADSQEDMRLRWVLTFTSRHPMRIAILFLLITLGGIWTTLQLRVDAYLLHDMPPEAQSLKRFSFADERLGGSKPYEIAVWPADTTVTVWNPAVLHAMAKIVTYLEEEYPVAQVMAPSKTMQFVKHASTGQYAVGQPSRSDHVLARRLTYRAPLQLVSKDEKKARITGSIKEYGSLNTAARNIQLQNFIDQHITPGVIEYRITGTNHLIDQTHHLLASSMAASLGWAVLLVSLLFGFYFRSVKWAILALIPNVVPLLITGMLLYLLDVPIQLSTSLIFVLVFGIVVDDTIHFLATFRRSPPGTIEEKLQYTMDTAGRGMLNTTLTLVAGFGLFLLSGFGGTYYLGFFLCIALLAALITDWLLLPVILRKFNR